MKFGEELFLQVGLQCAHTLVFYLSLHKTGYLPAAVKVSPLEDEEDEGNETTEWTHGWEGFNLLL